MVVQVLNEVSNYNAEEKRLKAEFYKWWETKTDREKQIIARNSNFSAKKIFYTFNDNNDLKEVLITLNIIQE